MKAITRLMFYVYLLLVLFSISGCCKLACVGTEIFISFEKFKRYETDTVIFLSYEAHTNFSVLKDSTLYGFPVPLSDTSTATDAHSIYPDREWIIKVPSVNKEYKFSDFNISTARCDCGNYKYQLVRTYKVNGREETSLFHVLAR